MIILVGDTMSLKIIAQLKNLGWGRMFATFNHNPNPYPNEPWGFDNGAYRSWRKGEPFDNALYLRRLENAHRAGVPYLGVVPDIVAGGMRSLDFSLSYLSRLPKKWPWYLAIQDGMTMVSVESVIGQFSGLFLGGTLRFKSTAPRWIALAHRHGKKFHYGRCGTIRRLEYVRTLGVDSLDSAFPLWTAERLGIFMDVCANGTGQLQLFSSPTEQSP
jgi:hypothetical protein